MRPIRITNVTGNSPPVPLDAYTIGSTTAVYLTGGGALQMTINNVYDPAAILTWFPAPTKDATTGMYTIPGGVRGLRATGMAAADVLLVSQQGLI